MANNLSVIVVGCGNMGSSHARSYNTLEGFDLVALVDKDPKKRETLSSELGEIDHYSDFELSLSIKKPDAVAICTYPDSHASLVEVALKAGCHVFVEKPIATTVNEANSIVNLSNEYNRKVVVGYILRVHPSWKKFIEIAQTLGKPLVMRMNLNQQSSGKTWHTHKMLMESMSPIVDCGVHYVDVMCQITRSQPVSVNAIGARLSNQISPDMYNYGQLQVTFDDGSVGWYEAGWGPMISEMAFFVKDIVGPKGSVHIMDSDVTQKESDDIDSHTKTNRIKIHYSDLDDTGNFIKPDEIINTEEEPNHQSLCDLEQKYFHKAIIDDLDLTNHLFDAVNSLKIVLAADEAFRTGTTIYIK